MSYTVDRRYVPSHFVGRGQFQHKERAHYANAAGNWVAPPTTPSARGGFTQVRRPVNAGFVRVPGRGPVGPPALHPVIQHLANLTGQGSPPLALNPAFAAGDTTQSPAAYAQPAQSTLAAILAALLRHVVPTE